MGFLLPDWPVYFNTFDMYLSHPASTVRQATSNIFKFLGAPSTQCAPALTASRSAVAKDTSNPTVVKLVLQGLAANWSFNRDALTTRRFGAGMHHRTSSSVLLRGDRPSS